MNHSLVTGIYYSQMKTAVISFFLNMKIRALMKSYKGEGEMVCRLYSARAKDFKGRATMILDEQINK